MYAQERKEGVDLIEKRIEYLETELAKDKNSSEIELELKDLVQFVDNYERYND